MSGIAVIWHRDGSPLAEGELRSNIEELAHRSPDGIELWSDASVGMAFGRFHTTPEAEAEVQPLEARDGIRPRDSVVLVIDGRVDDRDALRSRLAAADRPPRSDSDAELMLQAYLAWGIACVERVIGDWAFAIWDGRMDRMFFGCDPFGSRSLFYCQSGTSVVIGSEPQQVQAHPATPTGLNWGVIGEYLCDRWVASEETMFAGVRRLLPARAAICDAEGLRNWRYWPPPQLPDLGPEQPDHPERFRELLEESIRDRLRASTPVGVLLSGGLDSSSIACLTDRLVAREPGPWPELHGLSHTYPGMECDESEYIDAVDRSVRFPIIRLPWNADPTRRPTLDRASDFPNVLFIPGHIAGICNHAPEAHNLGARVLIDGLGGDELFSFPYPHLLDPLREGDWGLLWQRAGEAARSSASSPWSQIARHALWPLMPEPPKRMWRALRARFAPRPEHRVKPWIDPDFARRHALASRLRRPHDRIAVFELEAKNLMATLLTRSYNAVFANEWSNLVNARLGIEQRHPFLDRRLADHCLAVPESVRVADARPKALLMQAMGDILPHEVRARTTKAVFDSVGERELNDGQRDAVDRASGLLKLERMGILKSGAEKRLLSALRAGNPRAMTPVGTILGLELFLRHRSGA